MQRTKAKGRSEGCGKGERIVIEELKELKKYKSAREFARAHGKKASEEDISFGDILKGVAKDGVALAAEKINSEFLDPYGLSYEPSAEAKAEGERLKRLEELDATRPEIKSHLTFSIMPEEKAKGLHAKIGLFAKSWNQFADEIKEGRMEIAEVVDPSDKIHAYVLHFHRKKKEYYGLIAQKEYENLKELKDYITFMTPDNAFEPENHHSLEFDW